MMPMSTLSATVAGTVHDVTVPLVLAQAERPKPQGPEFGKASPVGLFVIIALLIVVLTIGVLMNRRIRRLERRRAFAERHGVDLFDTATLDRLMKEEGFDERVKGSDALLARTEVPDGATSRFTFSDDAADTAPGATPTGEGRPAAGPGDRPGA